MQKDITEIVDHAKKNIREIKELSKIPEVKSNYLGRNGQLTQLFKTLEQLSADLRSQRGTELNQAKQLVLGLLDQREAELQKAILESQLASEALDVTLPGRGQGQGNRHPLSLVSERVETIFSSLGFQIVEGPEVEDEYYNFEALNIPVHHPARAMHDTFYLENGQLLRTHTSPVQIRVMEKQQPPLRIVTPGRVYRCDFDLTHTPMFHQLEGLMVDERCTFVDLKGLLEEFVHHFFETELDIRFRPSYFPFTEPSAEMDIRLKGQSDWLEILGCGMVHPHVFKAVGIDNERYTGFAFGMGLDRLAMLRYRVPDLRLFFESDKRFLAQF